MVRYGAICAFWTKVFQSRSGRDSAASSAAINMFTQAEDGCRDSMDAVVAAATKLAGEAEEGRPMQRMAREIAESGSAS